jgi:hypothetical protein
MDDPPALNKRELYDCPFLDWNHINVFIESDPQAKNDSTKWDGDFMTETDKSQFGIDLE